MTTREATGQYCINCKAPQYVTRLPSGELVTITHIPGCPEHRKAAKGGQS